MGSMFGRAMAVAGAVVVALGPAAGVAAAKPRPPVLAFSPAPYDYGQVAAGQAASQTFTLANTGGHPTALVRTELESPTGVAVDASHIYWADSGSGTISKTLLTGGLITPLARPGQFALPAGVAVDSGHVYWANSGVGSINEVPLAGGTVTTLFNGQAQPWGVAVDSGHIYWTDSGDGTIKEAPQLCVSHRGDPGKLFMVSAAGSGYWFICSDTAQSCSAASGSSA